MRYIILLFLSVGIVWASEHTVKIGVLAKRSFEVSFKRWNATAEYLSEVIPGKTFEIVPIPFDSILPYVADKKIDFILANSGFYVELESGYGVQRITTLVNKHIAGVTQKEFGGVIFSHVDNKERFKDIDSLRGASFAAVNEKSLGGWQMAWREILEHDIDRDDDFKSFTFKGTHDKTVYAVLNKEVEVGTVRSDTLERMALEEKIDLSKIHIIHPQDYDGFPFMISTRLYPEWPFAKLKHTSDTLSKQVAIALMQIQPSDKASMSASINGWGTPLNYQTVHECFKILEIPPYFHVIKIQDVIYKYRFWILFYLIGAIIGFGMLVYQVRLTRHLRQTQDELVQIEKMASLGRLVAGVAHEINTPIGIGVTAASHLKQEVEGFNKDYKEETLTQSSFESFIDTSIQSSEIILANLDRAAQLVQSFKQISVDQSSDEIRSFYVNEYLNSIVTSLMPTLKTTTHKIEIICSESIQIESNPGVFYQIFSNFIMNSLIHGFEDKENGNIQIIVHKEFNDLEITYKDDGKGINKDGLAKIFDPFFTTKRDIGGSGLGTHIVYNLVTQKLNGTITASSHVGKDLTYNMHFKGIKYV